MYYKTFGTFYSVPETEFCVYVYFYNSTNFNITTRYFILVFALERKYYLKLNDAQTTLVNLLISYLVSHLEETITHWYLLNRITY